MRLASMTLVGCALAACGLAAACGSNSGSPAAPGDDAGQLAETSMLADTAAPPVDSGTAPTGDAQGDAGEAGEAGFPAFLPDDVPQVADGGGPVMTAPKVVPIFYASDDPAMVASVSDFITKLPGSSYWSAFAPEYGVGDLTALTPIMLTDSLTAYWDDSQIQAYLTAKLEANDPAWPAPDANTIYAFFFPPGVTITTTGMPLGDGGADAAVPNPGAVGCEGFGGYHDNITLSNNMNVSYAVVPRCASFPYGLIGHSLTGIDAITGPASHEIAESATDPFPGSTPAFSTLDAPHSYWGRLMGGGEVGDLCALIDSSFTKTLPGIPYAVQRIWSNLAARAGTDPCVPAPAGNVYFNAYPQMTDMVTLTSRGGSVTAKGVEIPVGGSAVVEFDIASSASTQPITLAISDGSSTGHQYLEAQFVECNNQATCGGVNGDKLHAKITVVSAGRRGTEPFQVEAQLPSNDYHLWAGLIAQPTEGGTGFPMDAGGGG